MMDFPPRFHRVTLFVMGLCRVMGRVMGPPVGASWLLVVVASVESLISTGSDPIT